MKHFLFICLAVLALGNRSIALEGRPNILLIQTDDQGYDDIGIHHPPGENLLETPHIDRLAQQSLQFENYYMSTVCAPSRAMLLTGRHHYKAGVWWVHGGTDWVNLDETLLAEPLKAAGYRTAHFGKWHSGKGDGYWPWDRGFDEGTYVDLYFYRDNRMLRNSKPLQTHGWTEKALADLAIDYLKDAATRDEPFFIYYNPITAHTGKLSTQHAQEPREDLFAPEEYVSKYEAKGLSGMFARLYGALDFLDTQLGRIFQTLEETGQMDNTIILYMSDNGSLRLSGRGEALLYG
jgi:arylsulfatase A-like enzyme